MSRRAHRLGLTLLVLVIAALVGGGTGPVLADPASPASVGLGDSYAWGLGTGEYDGSSGDCKRSPKAYAPLVAADIGAALTFVACSGATTADVAADQLNPLSDETTDVTLTVGGNDVGFVEVISTCALSDGAACLDAIDVARALITTQLPDRLDALYADIDSRAPNARVFVVGYPRLFNGHDCSLFTDFTRKEMQRLNRTANLLDRVIRGHARAAGLRFVDPRSAFEGHAVCDIDAWVNDVVFPIEESFHPTIEGQAAFARQVLRRR